MKQRGRDQMRLSWMQKRERNKAVAVAIITNKYKKIGRGKEMLQPHEQIETMTGWRMMNAQVKQRKRNGSNLKENNRLRINNNHNHSNRKHKKRSRSK
ncbi:MAG: hypothetical protein EZS28_044564 [Streblomastix strix]|uniref:Uncharacterized protein n=1 Tax=Streblomastix strix TaxID=222440 RepID=A0A5J4TPS7_9EUKA|nr:MAG: hypothetical protein EZS28_044564 [Streblomastix strix]